MLVENQKLNKKIFDVKPDMEAIRTGFGQGLLEAGEADERVVGLCADLTKSTKMHLFREKFPERFIQIGVAEQNLATVASGMAAMGKIPFISSYAMFSPGRNWEQIRTTICYNDQPVKIVGSHAGVSVGPDGGTHQAIEDIAITRVIPRMVVLVPADFIEARKAVTATAKTMSPAYLRLAREKTGIITTDQSPFEIGRANILWNSKNPEVAIVACGSLVHNALLAAKKLEGEKIGSIVINNHTIKPMDKKTIYDVAAKTGAVVTVEEHQVAGGMGSAVAEVLAQHHPVPMEFVGVEDKFGQSGKPEELVEHFGLGVDGIIRKVKKVIERKS